MRYDRIVSATAESLGSGVVADAPFVEMEMSGVNSFGHIIRLEIGAAEGADPLSEIQELELYRNEAAGTGGTALTEIILRGGGTIQGSAARNRLARAVSPIPFYFTAFDWRKGFLYLPAPEERPLLAGLDSPQPRLFGASFPTAPDVAVTFSWTLVWGEWAP